MFSFLVLTLALEAAVLPQYVPETWHGPQYSVTQELELTAWDMLYVGASHTTRMVQAIQPYLDPIHEDYKVNAGLRLGGFTLGVEHLCHHPVVSYLHGPIADWSAGGYNKVFLRWEGQIGKE